MQIWTFHTHHQNCIPYTFHFFVPLVCAYKSLNKRLITDKNLYNMHVNLQLSNTVVKSRVLKLSKNVHRIQLVRGQIHPHNCVHCSNSLWCQRERSNTLNWFTSWPVPGTESQLAGIVALQQPLQVAAFWIAVLHRELGPALVYSQTFVAASMSEEILVGVILPILVALGAVAWI